MEVGDGGFGCVAEPLTGKIVITFGCLMSRLVPRVSLNAWVEWTAPASGSYWAWAGGLACDPPSRVRGDRERNALKRTGAGTRVGTARPAREAQAQGNC